LIIGALVVGALDLLDMFGVGLTTAWFVTRG